MDTPSEPRVDATLPPPDPLTASDALRFEYDMGPSMTRAQRVLYGVGALCTVLFVLPRLLGHPQQLGPMVLFVCCVGAAAAFATITTVRGWRRGAHALVAIADGALHVPALGHWRGRRRIALADLQRVVIAPVSGVPTLFAGIAGGAPVVLPLDGFSERRVAVAGAGAAADTDASGDASFAANAPVQANDDARRFVDALTFRSRVRTSEVAVDFGPTRLALGLLTLLVVLHLLRETFGTSDIASLISWGGLVRTLVLEGQWYRLLLYAGLQPNALALALQIIALAVLLPGLQRSLGLARTVLVLLGGVLVAGIGALGWVDGDVGYGADALVYALLGALIWLRISTPGRIAPTIWRLPTWLWVGLLCVDLLLAPFTLGVGWPLRIMGLLAGLAVTSVTEWFDARVRGASLWASVAVLCLGGLGVAHALVDGLVGSAEDEAVRIVESPRASLADMNLGGWVLATSRQADVLVLGRARTAMAKRIEVAPGAPAAMRDTLATLHYRLGDYAAAVALESEVQRQEPQAVFATQLARFARAAGGIARADGAVVERLGDRVCVQSPSGALLDVDVTIDVAERMVGIMQFERVAERACGRLPEALRGNVQLAVGRVNDAAQPSGNGRVSYWAADQGILALP